MGKGTKQRERMETIGIGMLGLLCLVLVWQLLVQFTAIGNNLPYPVQVMRKLADACVDKLGKNILPEHILISMAKVMAGYGSAAVFGVLTGLLMARSRVGNAMITPLFSLIKPIPGIVWMPLAILWWGTGTFTQCFIIFVGGFSHMVLNTCAGALAADPQLVGAAKMLGANERQIFFYIILPSAVPYIFAGLQVALSACWMAVLAAEMMTATSGIGWIIVAGKNNSDMVQVLAGIVVIALIGLILSNIMREIERKLCSWARRED